jgi:hypothetical protein
LPIKTQSNVKNKPNASAPFEAEAVLVLEELRPALAAVLECLSPSVARATDLGRLLNLDRNLSWSLFNAAHAHDARTLPSLLPGQRAMERFFAAAALHGVPDSAIDRARAAFDRFERLVARHARNRDAFVTMVAEIGAANGESANTGADAKHKRSAFRATSLLRGRQARVGLHSMVVHPSQRQGVLDRVFLKGMIGVHQTRRGMPLHTAFRRWQRPASADPLAVAPYEALDPRESAPEAIGLLRDFCSQPPPTFRIKARSESFVSYGLVADGLGASSEVTYFTGHIARASAALPGAAPETDLALSTGIEMPTEVNISEVLIHESIWDDRLPAVNVYDWPLDGSPAEFSDEDLLPTAEKVFCLGRGLEGGRTPLVPRYVEMLAYVMERVGWNPAEFRLFRSRIDHPLRYSRIRIAFQR